MTFLFPFQDSVLFHGFCSAVRFAYSSADGALPTRRELFVLPHSSDVLIFATLERLSHDDIFPPRSLRNSKLLFRTLLCFCLSPSVSFYLQGNLDLSCFLLVLFECINHGKSSLFSFFRDKISLS